MKCSTHHLSLFSLLRVWVSRVFDSESGMWMSKGSIAVRKWSFDCGSLHWLMLLTRTGWTVVTRSLKNGIDFKSHRSLIILPTKCARSRSDSTDGSMFFCWKRKYFLKLSNLKMQKQFYFTWTTDKNALQQYFRQLISFPWFDRVAMVEISSNVSQKCGKSVSFFANQLISLAVHRTKYSHKNLTQSSLFSCFLLLGHKNASNFFGCVSFGNANFWK